MAGYSVMLRFPACDNAVIIGWTPCCFHHTKVMRGRGGRESFAFSVKSTWRPMLSPYAKISQNWRVSLIRKVRL